MDVEPVAQYLANKSANIANEGHVSLFRKESKQLETVTMALIEGVKSTPSPGTGQKLNIVA